jgi:hypothetical protein
LIYNGEDQVKAVGQGEVSDQIHQHVLEQSLFHVCVESLQRRFCVWEIGLGFLAFGASFDVFFYKLSESGSFVQLLHELPCIQDTRMAPCWAIVDFSQYSPSFLNVVVEKKFSDRRFGVGKQGVIKEDTRFVGIHLLVKVLSLREEISNGIGVARYVGQFIVEILEVLDPLSLSTGDLLRLTKILEVLVVSANFDGVRGA